MTAVPATPCPRLLASGWMRNQGPSRRGDGLESLVRGTPPVPLSIDYVKLLLLAADRAAFPGVCRVPRVDSGQVMRALSSPCVLSYGSLGKIVPVPETQIDFFRMYY